MFVVNVKYSCSLDEINNYLAGHRQFLEEQYVKGIFIASGPQIPREGGLIIVNSKIERNALDELLSQDPFKKNGLATYTITEFTPLMFDPALSEIL